MKDDHLVVFDLQGLDGAAKGVGQADVDAPDAAFAGARDSRALHR